VPALWDVVGIVEDDEALNDSCDEHAYAGDTTLPPCDAEPTSYVAQVSLRPRRGMFGDPMVLAAGCCSLVVHCATVSGPSPCHVELAGSSLTIDESSAMLA